MTGLCCDCIYYKHGVLENPCERGNAKCGYLKEGCWQWSKVVEEREMPTKRCAQCHEVLPIKEFYKYPWSPDKLSYICKACKKKNKEEKKNEQHG